MNHRLLSSATRVALATAGLILATGPTISQTVGKTAAVNPASTASGRTLTLGSEIIHKERIKTSDSGSLQLMFLDRSTMNIGPNSDVVIDEYVFDPNTNAGKMSVSIGKGLMRFVGGQISHDGNATVKTPSATMGIRGAVGSFSFDPNTGLTSASNDCKDCSITLTGPNGQSVTIPPGYTATVGRGGNITLAPTTQDQANKNLKNTGSKNGQQGGADDKTSKDAKNKDGEAGQNSGDQNQITGLNPLLPPPPPPVVGSFALTMNGCCNNAIGGVPFLNPALDGPATDTLISPVLGIRNANPGPAGAPDGRFLQYSMFLGNTDNPADHWLLVAVGGLRSDGQGGTVAEGGFAGTGSGNESTPGSTQGSFSSPAGQVTTNSRLPTAMTVTNHSYDPSTAVYTNTPSTYVQGNNAATVDPTEFTFTQNAVSTAVPTGLGTYRPTVTLQGYVGGLTRSEQTVGGTGSSYFLIGNKTNNLATNDAGYLSNDPSKFTVNLDPSNSSVTASMEVVNKSSAGPPAFGSASLNFGDSTSSAQTRSAYVDYDTFAALDQRATNGTPTSTIDGQPLTQSDGFLINADASIRQQVATKLNITVCQCDYTRWGFWSMTSKQTIEGNVFDDRNHMNLWVAGRPAAKEDIPTTGEASYSGHIVANVRDQNGTRLAGGNFTNNVNFGTRSIGANATFDGATFTGTLKINQVDPRNFGTTTETGLMGGAGALGRTMDMNGSFFQGKTSKYGEMGGNVFVTGTNYMAGGIFAGKKN